MGFIELILSDNLILFLIIIFLFTISLVSLIVALCAMSKYKKLNNRYKKFMNKLGQGEKVEEILSEYLESVRFVKNKEEELEKEVQKLENNMKKCVQKVGLIRYNAYNDTGSDLSFTMALMDFDDNGVVVNGLYSRESSSIFAKPLVKGETKYNLSAEEIQAIDIARTSNSTRY